jgi:hypothetical protein
VFVSEFVELGVIRPHIHGKFELTRETRAADKRSDATVNGVVWRAFRQERAIRASAPDHSSPLHVVSGIARIHAPDVRP